jgi:hypothetical protein
VGPGSSPRNRQADRPTEQDIDYDPDVDLGHDHGPTESSSRDGSPEPAADAAFQEQLDALAEPQPDPKSWPAARRWPLRVATAVAVLGVAGTIGFGYAWHNLNGQQNDVNAAKKQAQNYIIALTNFDPKGLDNEINKIQSYTTGNFKTSIAQFFSNDTRKTLLSRNAASRGQIRAIYPQSNSGGHITFFAVVDDTIANNQLSAPASDEIDMTVDMVNTSQGWRVANNTFLQSPLFSPTQQGSQGSQGAAPQPGGQGATPSP